MLTATITNDKVKFLRTMIDVSQGIVNGPQLFQFSENGLFFESMEQSGAVFVTFNVTKGFFKEYKLDKLLELKLNIDDLKKILSRALGSDEELIFNFNDANKFAIHFIKSSGQKRKYEIPIHDIEEDDKRDIGEKARSIPLSCQINLEPGSFKDILADVGIAADKSQKHLQIKVNKQLITFEINRGMEGMNALVELPVADNQISISMEDDDDVASNYDMDYLEKLTKLDALTHKIGLELATDGPMRIIFNLSDDLDFMFLMAPLELGDEDDDFEDEYDEDDDE